jgi:regulator of protease activity HflC (stomatin/prohibitin superfamily)
MRVRQRDVHICMCITFAVGMFVMMVSLLAMYTLQEVAQSEFAVEYNTYEIEFGKVLSQGKYNVAVGSELIKFQRTLQDLDLGGVSCLSKDQVIVSLDVNIQIQYSSEALVPVILQQFSTNKIFKTFLAGVAKSSVLNSCSLFDADTYFTNRASVDLIMTENIAKIVNVNTLGVSVVFFQLINIAFPSSYNRILTAKQTTQQQEITLENDRQNAITVANTNLFVANNTANIRIIRAQQEAATLINQATTQKLAIDAFWSSRTESFAAVMENFEYTNSSQLLDFVNSEIIRTNRRLVAGVK